MASVKSLGAHQPTGLQHAIQELLLPPDPPADSYTWEVIPDGANTNGEGLGEGEDELLTVGNCVIWSRGGIFRKSFKFDLEKEPITQALLTHFPTSDETKDPNAADSKSDSTATAKPKRPLSKALVVFLKTQAHIFFLSGPSHVVHMPFEVESACAAPCGVIIQRNSKTDNVAPISLKFPRVPPNSFVSSQPSPAPQRNTNAGSTFSVEGLGKPKTLPLRLSSTFETMFDTPLEANDSQWPRLVCLTDPLLELGLVVTPHDKSLRDSRRTSSIRSPFLDPAEEILHIEAVKEPGYTGNTRQDELVLAVTVNRESSMYTVWRLTYLKHDDFFIGRQKKPKTKSSRRRSSMPPGLRSGAATPVPAPSFRESFGAPMPGKKPRKSEKLDKTIEAALSLDAEKGAEVSRRQSRRVSSLLARADLSASHERSAFVEQSISSSYPGDRRHTSHGSQRGRLSGGYPHMSMSGTFSQNLNSLLEAPVDDVLDELRAGGDFEGFHDMGIDDHEFDGLTREILLTKVHSVSMDNTNVRYSLSNQPARSQSKVFILTGPPYAADETGRRYLLVGIQDALDKRLQLLTLHLQKHRKFDLAVQAGKKDPNADSEITTLSWGMLRRAQNVVDSCKVFDGDQAMILILSENGQGHRELSIQAPWSAMSIIILPKLFYDNLNSLDYSGRHVNREVRGRKSVGADFSATQIQTICHTRPQGVVDMRDKDGNVHRVQIQLQPSSPQVRKALGVCRSMLPPIHGEKMLPGWWHIAKWLREQDDDVADLEWSAFVIELFVIFLALGHDDASTLSTMPPRPRTRTLKRASSSAMSFANLELMRTYDAPNAMACPPWMRNRGWEWLMGDGNPTPPSSPDTLQFTEDFLSLHIRLTKEYMVSKPGQAAIGAGGYLPTAFNRSVDSRKQAAWSIVAALHLFVEEQKLDVLAPDYLSPGRADLRVILCQIGRWLRWHDFVALYELGIQVDVDPKHDAELELSPPIMDAPGAVGVFDWIQSHLTGDKSIKFPTLADVYTTGTRETVKPADKQRRWAPLTPRTLMFEKLFSKLTSSSTHVEVVEALHACGFTVGILETLPEAVLAPLQDAISMCQPHPPASWPRDLLDLVKRSDMALTLRPSRASRFSIPQNMAPNHNATWDFRMIAQSLEEYNNVGYDEGEGTERQAVVRALFKDDRRLNEAQNLLSTHRLRVVRLNPTPAWTEPEYLEKQKELVAIVATSTLAIPAGRGLLYYNLRFPLLTQKFFIGGFNLTCLVKPANNTVGVEKSMFTEEKVNWAFFHQGVAGGLAISPNAKGIDTSWILYNKPGQDLSNRHAGFLLALGLNGHLKSVAKWVAFKYLTPKHTMTSIGLLLGLAASYLGTMDSLITRLLSVHVTRMLPRGAAELNLSHYTQTTGIMGIGLLYCNSQHRRMSEIMMSEIEYVDDEDDEDPLRNEGYRLAAGFALGFINLGKGTDLKGLHDMRITEKLLTLASATKKVEEVSVLDRSTPGAVVAIALIFMKSEDHIIARKVDVPDSILQFGYVRPDILLLRTLAKNLIMWSQVEPSFPWIKASLPREFRWRYMLSGTSKLQSKDMPFFSIIAGLCFSVGLRYAGSANTKVRDILVHYLDQFIRISRLDSGTYDAHMSRSSIQMCMDVVALSAASVMAGTGDLVVMRRLRALHGRDDVETTYGSHLAAHLAIGALFLGCGTATFSTSNMAIAALLVSFYPIFPADVQDNRSHLQAFRHFWVLATDPRCLVAKDVATGQPVSVPVLIKMKKTSAQSSHKPSSPRKKSKMAPPVNQDTENTATRRITPCLLPPLEEIASVRTDATAKGFWNVELDFEKDPSLIEAFRRNQSLHLRRRNLHEGAFGSTIRALGADDLPEFADTSSVAVGDQGDGTQRSHNPLDWIFEQDALSSLTHAERSLVLNSQGGDIGDEGASSAVDARLVLEAGMDGWSRENLQGLKLLFEWADKRSVAQDAENNGHPAPVSPKKTSDRGKGKVRLPDELAADTTQQNLAAGSDETNGWWLRDSVIEMLKGKAWLAARDEEA